jgi:hypothetical protein
MPQFWALFNNAPRRIQEGGLGAASDGLPDFEDYRRPPMRSASPCHPRCSPAPKVIA